MKRHITCIALLCAAVLGSGTAATAHEIGRISLNDITTAIVPTSELTGADRDFDGNGPIIRVGTRLIIGRNGRAIFAEVSMRAHETGGDGSATSIGPVRFLVWRWKPDDGAHFVSRIVTNRDAFAQMTSAPGCGPIGCATIGPAEDGGLIVTHTIPEGNYLRDITFLGDTSGDDISTDQNPHGDTSIRRIRFDDIVVEFSDQLVRG